jgi:glycosyltransferase involved in cell wall biosynthesis
MSIKISIIIIVKNDRGIADTLTNLVRQKRSAPTEVLVIDASLPEVLQDIKEAHPEARWFQFVPKILNKTSIPEQRNFGIRQAIGDVIVFIDANCLPVDGWLERLTAPILNGEESITSGSFDSIDVSNRIVSTESKSHNYLTCSGTGNLAFHKKVWETVNGFDENFLFGSDVDFTWRCVDAGYRILSVPDAKSTHDWGTLREDLRRSLKYGNARADLFKKHRHRIYGQLIKESVVIPIYTIWLLSLLITFIYPWYPLSIFLFVILFIVRNPKDNPIRKVLTTIFYTIGFYQKMFKNFI